MRFLFVDKNMTDDIGKLRNDVDSLTVTVDALIAHGVSCEEMHKQNQEHRKRADDATNQNTQATLKLAKSQTDNSIMMDKLATSIDRLTEQADRNQPTIDTTAGWFITFANNKILFTILAAIVSGAISAIITAAILVYKSLPILS